MRSVGLALLLLTSSLALALCGPAQAVPTSEWFTPMVIDGSNLSAVGPQVAFDNDGNAMAAWQQTDGTRNHVWASRYVRGGGWDAPVQIENNATFAASNVRVVFDGVRTFWVAWTGFDGNVSHLWASHLTREWGSSWWAAPERLENHSLSTTRPSMASDGAGNVLVVWEQVETLQRSISANRHALGSGWSGPEVIYYNNTSSSLYASASYGANGDAFVVWFQSTGSLSQPMASRRASGAGAWDAAAPLGASDEGVITPRVAADAAGNAVAVWTLGNSNVEQIWSSVYSAGSGWSAAVRIENETTYSENPYLAMDAAGNAIAVWYQGTGFSGDIFANRYVRGVGWGTARGVGTGLNPSLGQPHVFLDAVGNGLVLWPEFNGSNQALWSNRFSPTGGWGSPAIVNLENGFNVGSFGGAVDAQGNAMVLWSQSDGAAASVWAARLEPIDTEPPAVAIASPVDGAQTNLSTVLVVGRTEVGARVTVNGVEAAVAMDGTFAVRVALARGSNDLTASATDRAGNTGTASVAVVYDDPQAVLEGELAAAQAELADAQARVDALEAQAAATAARLAMAEANVTAAQAEIAALLNNSSTTAGALAAAQADLAAAQSDVAALEGDLAASASAQAAARDELNQTTAQVASLQAALITTNAQLSTTSAALNGTQASLAQTRTELAQARADYNASKTQGTPPVSGGDSGLGAALGAAGIAVGAIGVAMAMRAGKKGAAPPKEP